MSLKFFDIPISLGVVEEFRLVKSYLNQEYNITTLYEDSANIVFICPNISNKVIRFYLQYGEDNLYVYLGDSWTSGTTLANQITISGTRLRMGTYFRMFTSQNLLIFNQYGTISGTPSIVIILGKLSNDEFLASAISTSGKVIYNSTNQEYYSTITCFAINFMNSDSKLFSQPLIFIKGDGLVAETINKEIITIPEVINASYIAGFNGAFYQNYYFTSTFSNLPTSLVFAYT